MATNLCLYVTVRSNEFNLNWQRILNQRLPRGIQNAQNAQFLLLSSSVSNKIITVLLLIQQAIN